MLGHVRWLLVAMLVSKEGLRVAPVPLRAHAPWRLDVVGARDSPVRHPTSDGPNKRLPSQVFVRSTVPFQSGDYPSAALER